VQARRRLSPLDALVRGAEDRERRRRLLRPLVHGGANNAGIAAMALYADRVPQFTALLAAENGDFRASMRGSRRWGAAAATRAGALARCRRSACERLACLVAGMAP
jgi:predicted aminopeptidase